MQFTVSQQECRTQPCCCTQTTFLLLLMLLLFKLSCGPNTHQFTANAFLIRCGHGNCFHCLGLNDIEFNVVHRSLVGGKLGLLAALQISHSPCVCPFYILSPLPHFPLLSNLTLFGPIFPCLLSRLVLPPFDFYCLQLIPSLTRPFILFFTPTCPLPPSATPPLPLLFFPFYIGNLISVEKLNQHYCLLIAGNTIAN